MVAGIVDYDKDSIQEAFIRSSSPTTTLLSATPPPTILLRIVPTCLSLSLSLSMHRLKCIIRLAYSPFPILVQSLAFSSNGVIRSLIRKNRNENHYQPLAQLQLPQPNRHFQVIDSVSVTNFFSVSTRKAKQSKCRKLCFFILFLHARIKF